jgi:hypothetical protein
LKRESGCDSRPKQKRDDFPTTSRDALNPFNGNRKNAEMVKAFISSSEYRQRFGP